MRFNGSNLDLSSFLVFLFCLFQMKKQIIPIGIIVLAFFIGIYFYPQMPEQMASHWNAEGQVDGYLPKFWALFLMPILSFGLYLLFIVIPKIDPLKENIEKFRNYYDTFVIIFICFLFYIYLVTIFWNLGFQFNMGYVLIPAISVLFYYCGILIENAERNWFVGIRTPWTLSDDGVWKKTHIVGAKLFKIYALLLLVSLLFIDLMPQCLVFVILIPAVLIVIYLFVYSYIEYQKVRK